MTPRPATLAQVAERAGVSVATVSKVINDTGRISAPTRERVLAAAEALRFVPNAQARSLHTGKTSIVGALILDSSAHRFAMPLIIGADTALSETNVAMIACDATGDPARALELVQMLRQRSVDGLIVIGEHQRVWPSLSNAIERPVVYVHGETTDPDDVVFLTDNRSGMAQVVEHLVDTGRSRFLHLTGPAESRAVEQRIRGLEAALAHQQARLMAPVVNGPWSQRWTREPVADLLRDHPDVDAIICGSDQIATGVAEAVVASGRSIPGDVAITGFDNWAVFAEEMEPALTTVDMNIEQLGAVAAGALHAAIEGTPSAPGVHLQPCSLVVRGSTAAPDRSRKWSDVMVDTSGEHG